MIHPPRPVDWLMLGFLCLAWGLAFLLTAVGLELFPPLTLVAIRLIIGAAVLYLIMRWQGHRLPREGHWWLRFAALTLMGNLVPFTLISLAQQHIASGQAGLLMALVPISTMVLAHYFVAHERLTAQRVIGVTAGFAGVAILVGGDALAGFGGVALPAQLAVIAATFSYAVNNVYSKRLPAQSGLVTATGSLIVGALLILPFSLVIEQPWQLPITAGPLLATLALGVASTGLATWVFFVVVANCGPNFLSLINYIIPALAFAAGALLLAEPVNSSQFLGLGVICAGIAISQRRRSRGF
jgi:drug/metabolite transporter (DMT)-like permease